ncbi:LuxR C-terminal-related transcriptional regulator [Lentzea sp. JNUCC 0626]|uniref:LuxR C-terminal-related transcriptional regulator n=1 Tax=Lentzea sp. JNUCC 0626 TaxID=3367513 RepID=UPI00374A6928
MTNNGLLEEVRRTRLELVRDGRWNEAERFAADAVPGCEPAALAYLPGSPGGGADPAVFRAVQAVHRGTGRAEAVAVVRCALERRLDAGTFWQAVTVLLHAGEIAEAHRHWFAAGDDLLGGRIMLARGDPRAAARLLGGERARRDVAVAWLVLALTETGEFERAGALLETEQPDGAEVCFARGRLLLAQGRSAAALDEFLDCGRRLTAWGVVNPAVLPWRSSAALAAADLGDLVLARICAEKDLVAARRWGAARGIGLALHAAALARGGDDVVLEEALTFLGDATADALRARHDLAQLLLARGEVDRARRHSRRLRETAFSPQWIEVADVLAGRLLRNAGESALSGQERRIALLARAGRSNREIAGELGLTLRTVECHLTAVYRKMGVAGRPGLRRAFVPTA